MMAERGLSWCIRRSCAGSSAMCRSSRSAGTALLAPLRGPGASMRPTSTRGRWTYLYRAVDKEETPSISCVAPSGTSPPQRRSSDGRTERHGQLPHKITLNGYQASHRGAAEALSEHPEGNQCKIRSSKYVNNLIEQDHRSIKLRLALVRRLWPQAFSKSRDDHRRHRTHAPDQKGSVQTRQAPRQTQNRS